MCVICEMLLKPTAVSWLAQMILRCLCQMCAREAHLPHSTEQLLAWPALCHIRTECACVLFAANGHQKFQGMVHVTLRALLGPSRQCPLCCLQLRATFYLWRFPLDMPLQVLHTSLCPADIFISCVSEICAYHLGSLREDCNQTYVKHFTPALDVNWEGSLQIQRKTAYQQRNAMISVAGLLKHSC